MRVIGEHKVYLIILVIGVLTPLDDRLPAPRGRHAVTVNAVLPAGIL